MNGNGGGDTQRMLHVGLWGDICGEIQWHFEVVYEVVRGTWAFAWSCYQCNGTISLVVVVVDMYNIYSVIGGGG